MTPIRRRSSISRLNTIRAALALGACACSSLVDPPLDPRAQRFSPPSVYDRWWSIVESCSGLTGSLSAISWYVVPGSDVVSLEGDSLAGYWAPASNSIVLAGTGTLNGLLVRHEMLHALVRSVGHSRSNFLERCGGIVYCTAQCVKDAGPPPLVDAAVPRVTSDSLDLGLSIVPDAPSSALDGGVFSLIVTATNPKPYPIVVTLNPLGLGRSFFYDLFGPTGGRGLSPRVLDYGITFFAAGETKRQYFDFALGDSFENGHVIPGTYEIHGGYDVRWVTREKMLIGP